MSLRKSLLFHLAKRWPSPIGRDHYKYTVDRKTYHERYFRQRYQQTLRLGRPVDVLDRRVLEIGCGEGPVSYFYARNFARFVVGIDVNREALETAPILARKTESRGPHFAEADALSLPFSDGSFDLVIADNTFEHFHEPQRAMEETFRVLSPGGQLYVPVFSSIVSKYGAHMKTHIKVPWCNVIFTEKIVIEVLAELSKNDPRIREDYPSIAERPLPTKLRQVRRCHDLNDITYAKFLRYARASGFAVDLFEISFTGMIGRLLHRLRVPYLSDIFSYGASAVLRKPG